MTDKKTLDLAREWAADIDADRETLSQDTIDAAADLISSLPDAWVSVDELREVVADHHIDMSEELMEALGALLPAPTPPTLADMPPEERAECQWMQASLKGNDRRVVITEIKEQVAYVLTGSGFPFGRIHDAITPLPDLPRMEWPASALDERAPEPAAPRPEDVPEFDPAYLYHDKDGDVWSYRKPYWSTSDGFLPCSIPPAKYGPYTRIEA